MARPRSTGVTAAATPAKTPAKAAVDAEEVDVPMTPAATPAAAKAGRSARKPAAPQPHDDGPSAQDPPAVAAEAPAAPATAKKAGKTPKKSTAHTSAAQENGNGDIDASAHSTVGASAGSVEPPATGKKATKSSRTHAAAKAAGGSADEKEVECGAAAAGAAAGSGSSDGQTAAAGAADAAAAAAVASIQVHRCRFVDLVPRAVRTAAFSPDGSRIAVAREDGELELWRTAGWALDLCVPGGSKSSITAVAWAKGSAGKPERLFVAGLTSRVMELDFATLQYKNIQDSYGGAVWSLALDHTGSQLAVGCEDGSVQLFDTEDGALEYRRTLHGSKGRVLSLCWHPTTQILYSGSADGMVRGWNITTRQVSFRIQLENLGGKPTLPWALAAFADFTLITGTSLGQVQIWDGHSGTLLHNVSRHSADVTCLAAYTRDTEQWVFAGGADGRVEALCRVPSETHAGGWQWITVGSHRGHTHDVLACTVSPRGYLVTGGKDTQLCAVYGPRLRSRMPRKLLPFPSWPLITMSSARRLVLVQHTQHVELWRLQDTTANEPFTNAAVRRGSAVRIAAPANECVLRVNAKGPFNISTSAISPDGNWICLADSQNTRLYSIADARFSPVAVPVPEEVASSFAVRLCFTSHSGRLLVACANGRVHLLSLSSSGSDGSPACTLLHTFASVPRGDVQPLALTTSAPIRHQDVETQDSDASDEESKDVSQDDSDSDDSSSQASMPIKRKRADSSAELSQETDGREPSYVRAAIKAFTAMSVSTDEQWLAVADTNNTVHVFGLDTLKPHLSLPRLRSPVSCVAFHPHSPTLVVVCSDSSFHLFDAGTGKLLEWCVEYGNKLPAAYRHMTDGDPVRSVTFNPAQPSSFLLVSRAHLVFVDLDEPVPHDPSGLPKHRRKERRQASTPNPSTPVPGTAEAPASNNFRIVSRYSPMMTAQFIGDNELCVVETPWLRVIQHLPEVISRHRFAT